MDENSNQNFGKGLIGTRWGLSKHFLGCFMNKRLDYKDSILVLERIHFASQILWIVMTNVPFTLCPQNSSRILDSQGLVISSCLLSPPNFLSPALQPCFSWQNYILEVWSVPCIKMLEVSSKHGDPMMVAHWMNLAHRCIFFWPM